MRVSLRIKVTAMTSCIIAAVFLLTGIVYYESIHSYATHSVYKQALGISQVGQAMINGDALQRIEQLKDKENEDYKEVKRVLTTLGHLIERGDIFAINTYEQNLVYLSDSVKENFLLSYERLPKERFISVLNKLKIGEPFYFKDYYDEYNKNILRGVLLPIFNSDQQLVGMVGYKIERALFYLDLYLVRWLIILSTVVSALVCIVLNYFGFKRVLRPVDKLMNTMNKVAKGDFKIEADVNRKDEIGKINKNLIKSCERISQMFEHITISSTSLKMIAERILETSKRGLVALEEITNSTREISLISYEQVDKRESAKLAITYLEEDMRIVVAEVDKEKKECKVSEELIEQMATHVSTIKQKIYELDHVFEIIDKHTVNLAAVTERQMAVSEGFTAMAESLNQESESLNKSVSRVKV